MTFSFLTFSWKSWTKRYLINRSFYGFVFSCVRFPEQFSHSLRVIPGVKNHLLGIKNCDLAHVPTEVQMAFSVNIKISANLEAELPLEQKKIAIKTHWEMVFQTLEEIITFTLAFLKDERLFQLEINSCRSQWILTRYHLADFSFQLF